MSRARQEAPLRRRHMYPDPIRQLSRWLQVAKDSGIELPSAMTLATANRQGRPAARIVLLKGVDDRGLDFFSYYAGRKAHELNDNPQAALVFCWLSLSRQVRVEGTVERLPPGESDRYFASRPRGHQLEAHASPQSRVIEGRAVLEERFAEVSRRFAGQVIPRPEQWGGYRLVPDALEFWQEGEHRLHDRLRYRRDPAGGWLIERLAP